MRHSRRATGKQATLSGWLNIHKVWLTPDVLERLRVLNDLHKRH